MKIIPLSTLLALAVLGGCPALWAQTPAPAQTSAQMIERQQSAMMKLGALDGLWRGTGWIKDRPADAPRQLTQTLRAGSLLDGTLKLLEIRGYQADGAIGFHAFNTISFDSQKNSYVIIARAGGRSGNFSFEVTADGYIWYIGDGKQGLRYTATVKDDSWTEVGESLTPGSAPVRVSEWTLRRVGKTEWPEGGALAAK
jgi:hypothetical protein